MTTEELYITLDFIDHTREKRSKMAAIILEDPSLITPLLLIISRVNDPISCRASWILESWDRIDKFWFDSFFE